MRTYSKGGKGEGFRIRDSGGLERFRECLLLTTETKASTTNTMLTIGKRQGFETETQEVLNTYTKRVIEAGILNKDPGSPEHR